MNNGSVSSRATEEAHNVFEKVKSRATSQLSSQKGRATGEMTAVANAVREASTRLRNEHHETVANVVEQAAGQLERLAQTIRDKDLDELLRDARRVVRRQPVLFVGGSFVAGLLVARFLKSSASEIHDEHGSDWRREWDGTGVPRTGATTMPGQTMPGQTTPGQTTPAQWTGGSSTEPMPRPSRPSGDFRRGEH